MSEWFVIEALRSRFPDLATAICLEGEEINGNWMSRLVRYVDGDECYYIKSYASRGRGLRKHMGRSRICAEWENLLAFSAMGVSTADLVAYGESVIAGAYRGVLITREVRGTRDLAALVAEEHMLLRDRSWRSGVIELLAATVRKMHRNRFVHNDLKWRNILVPVNGDTAVYLIDCPQGRKMPEPFLARGRIKDLACLDKIGKKELSKAERLRFYLAYKGKTRLSSKDKKEIYRVLRFFEGRE